MHIALWPIANVGAQTSTIRPLNARFYDSRGAKSAYIGRECKAPREADGGVARSPGKTLRDAIESRLKMVPDPFHLERFLSAQAPVFDAVLSELTAGRKRTHWMWFVFPQLRGLGHSAMAQRFVIGSQHEARAYYAHPVLGPRLVQCTERVLAVEGSTLHEIFGFPDDRKFVSSMTLFARATDDTEKRFRQALERFCGGSGDDRTLSILGADE